MELAGTIQDEFLTCNICLEDYRRPKQLPCLHTFCGHCLSCHIAQTVGQSGVLSVSCPICRRTSVPPDPDPRKLHQWADQYPDNFFVVSLRETLEARTHEGRGEEEGADSPSDHPTTRYFMGDVAPCSSHPTQHLTRYCRAVNSGACEECLAADAHKACTEEDHLEAADARNSATELLTKYRQEMERMKQDVKTVKQSFNRRPRLLQMKKEEVEISISEHFSALRSSCAKVLLARERGMVESLRRVVEEESGKTADAQNKCDDVTNSMTNTVSLFDTLTLSGPFNAMHVLARAEGQIANMRCLVSQMDRESKADSVSFQPSTHSLEDHVSSCPLGRIVAQFGSGDMAVPHPSRASGTEDGSSPLSIYAEGGDSSCDPQAEGSLPNVESRMSELKLSDAASVCTAITGNGREATHAGHPSAPPLRDINFAPDIRINGDTNTNSACSSAPLQDDDPKLSSYSQVTRSGQSSPLPSAPPMTELDPPPPSVDWSSHRPSSPGDWYDKPSSSPALASAFQQSVRKELSCKPVMAFSGNMPNESHRGGMCGAARMDQKNRTAFVDRYNRSVKIIDLHHAQVVGYLDLGELEPWDITFVADGPNLVVTCPKSRYLLFISTQERQLQIAFYYTTARGYCCVAHLKGDIFSGGICSPFGQPAVQVFDVKGSMLREILPGQFVYPRAIFSDLTGSQIIVSDWTSNTVVVVTSEGELVCRYKDAPSPKGVAVSELTGLLHVLDSKWRQLHLLDSAGHCVATSKTEGCRDPRTVVVVQMSSSGFPDRELMVIADSSNALHVLALNSSCRYLHEGGGGGHSLVQSTV